MWRIENTAPSISQDTQRFLDVLNTHADFFEPAVPVYVARAPGRLDLMGGIADYSGALVLELPLAVATFAAVQPVAESSITILSTTTTDVTGKLRISIDRETLLPSRRCIRVYGCPYLSDC